MSNVISRHLYLGFIRLHILYHAGKEPICGVELMEELEHHGYDVGPGTLYPMLHQMHSTGLIRYDHEIVNGKRRKNIQITAAGKKLLVDARNKLRELASEIIEDRDARSLRGNHRETGRSQTLSPRPGQSPAGNRRFPTARKKAAKSRQLD